MITMFEPGAAVLRGFLWAYHPVAPGLNPKHTIYTFFIFYCWNCNEKRTKNKKRPGLANLKKLCVMKKVASWLALWKKYYFVRREPQFMCPNDLLSNHSNPCGPSPKKHFSVKLCYARFKAFWLAVQLFWPIRVL